MHYRKTPIMVVAMRCLSMLGTLVFVSTLGACSRAKAPVLEPAAPMIASMAAATPTPKLRKPGEAPLDAASPPKDAIAYKGIHYLLLEPGQDTGEFPELSDRVTIHFSGWTADGKSIDTSRDGEPVSFPLEQSIKGWRLGISRMFVGQKVRLWVPASMSYDGEHGGNQLSVFEIDLLAIEKPPATPANLSAAPETALRTSSGLAYKVLQKGNGIEHPDPQDVVEVHYSGWTTDGKLFDSSVVRGQRANFPADQLIAGWTEGLRLMVVGDKTRFWIPENLAYKGAPGKPAGMLVFDVQLFSIDNRPKPPKAPDSVSKPPRKAKRTRSGLRYIANKRTKRGPRPGPDSRVIVHYSGWTTDGKLFDSSVVRDQPASFGLGTVIEGWKEGVQLMRAGDTFTFWIPEKLAYRGREGVPAGMLVFEVSLLSFE